MRRAAAGVSLLVALLFAIDRLYRVLHPVVNLERAGLVGLGALAVLLVLARLPLPDALRVRPLPGALAILASAAVGVLLIQAGVLASRSLGSGAVHALIVAAAYPPLGLREHRAKRVGPARAPARARPGAGSPPPPT